MPSAPLIIHSSLVALLIRSRVCRFPTRWVMHPYSLLIHCPLARVVMHVVLAVAQVRMRWSVVRDGGAVCGVVSGADDEATDSTAAKLGRATFACGARAGAEEAAETVALSRELSVRQIVRLVSSDQQGRLV